MQEQDLLLDEYETDGEKDSGTNNGENLSASTLALLDQLKPIKTGSADEVEEDRTKIIFCSRTHSQLTQFVNELKRIELPSALSDCEREEVIKHAPLGSRRTLCINSKVSRLTSTTAMNERCVELQKPGIPQDRRCEFLPSKQSPDYRERVETFRDSAIAQIQDIEDIAFLGRKMKICPYYASRSAIPFAEVLTLPYPLLLEKSARKALGVEIKDNVIIVDEAHNLASAIADTLSVSMPLSHLELAQNQMLGYCQKFKNRLKGKNRVYIAQIIRLMKACISRLQSAVASKVIEQSLPANDLIAGSGIDQIQPYRLARYIKDSKLIFKVEGYAEFLDQQSQQVDLKKHTPRQPQPKGVLAEFQALLVALMNPESEGKFFISQGEKELVLKYTLLDPRAHFEDVVREARAVILAGGTMSPMSDWADQLFSYLPTEQLETYSFGHIINPSHVLVEPLTSGPNGIEFDFTWNNRRSDSMISELALVLEKFCATAPDGLVVFFPSYEYLALVTSVWTRPTKTGSAMDRFSRFKQVFQESKDLNVDELLQHYSNSINCGKGALMFAVVGGKLSEGINFSDRLGRVVICVGLPYPNIKSAEWLAKVEFIQRAHFAKMKKEGLSEHECKTRAQVAGREYTDNTTMRAVNQSVGRAIRHKNDYAAIYLIDKRFCTPRIQNKLSTWLRQNIHAKAQSWQMVENGCRDFFTKNTVR